MKKIDAFPYLIAEIGGNHEGDFGVCKEMLQSAISGGAHAVKFQIYTGETIVNKSVDPERAAHFDKFSLRTDQYLELADLCEQGGVDFLASIWDFEQLEVFGSKMPFIKVGSGDLTAFPFLKKISQLGKPILLSTGLSTLKDIDLAYQYITKCNERYLEPGMLGIMQCTSMYPIPNSEANLRIMQVFRERYPQCVVGYSDHTMGTRACELAAILGADCLEFHFTLENINSSFRDHKVSLTQTTLKSLIENIRQNNIYLGTDEKKPTESELASGHVQSFRRALYLKKDMKAGDVISEEDLTALRPAEGVSACRVEQLIGSVLRKDIMALTPLNLDDFD